MKSSLRRIIAFAALLLISRCTCVYSHELADYVNALQGTNSRFEFTHGNTFPAVALPFGMHMWTPQTGKNGDGWKYQYFKDTIRGFQQSHQCSSWTNDYAVFSLMPTVGRPIVDEDERAAHFRHQDEVARPYYYRVALDNGTVAEMTPTERGAVMRFVFPRDKDAYLVLDGYTGTSGVKLSPAEGPRHRLRPQRTKPAGQLPQLLHHSIRSADRRVRHLATWIKFDCGRFAGSGGQRRGRVRSLRTRRSGPGESGFVVHRPRASGGEPPP